MDDRLSVSNVRAELDQHGLTVEELPADTSTAFLAAQSLDTTVDTIVKSLLFIAENPGEVGGQSGASEPVLVLAPGDRKVGNQRLAKVLGVTRVRLGRPDETLAITGYEVGGVPPLAHRRRLRTLLDRNLLQHKMVYAAAGSRNAIFRAGPHRLVELTGAEVVDVTE